MDKDAILKDVDILDTIFVAPKVYLEQFIKITAYYNAYINMENPTIQDRTDFINECYNSINLLSKLIATVSNGQRLESQVKVPVDDVVKNNSEEFNKDNVDKAFDTLKNHIEDLSKEENNIEEMNADFILGSSSKPDTAISAKEYRSSFIDASEIFYEELENWGISESLGAHDCMMAMAQCCDSYDTPKLAIRKIAAYLSKPIATVASSFAYIARNADFRKSQYSELLKNTDCEISKETLIEEYLTYC